jgi:TolB-like protein/class 3 adenylate cyclase
MNDTRKLAAILAADVVGYSRLMGEDEAGTAKVVREQRDAATPIVRSFGGRLVKTMGDGVLLEFPSVVAAVECAIAIQKMMAERNAALPEAKRILYRIGVNLGDVLIEGEDILGDGVNVAARLEGICEPGGICLSEDAYRQARGRIEAKFVDLGEQALKNIAQPVRAYALTPAAIATVAAATPTPAVATDKATGPPARKARAVSPRLGALAAALALAFLAAGGYAWHAGYAPRFIAASGDDKLANAPRLSIVVMPFENLSGDPDQQYFADGITDDLTTDLSHLAGSFVIARGTAFTYKGKPIDAKQIGRELGVRYLLEGSVRRVGEAITVNAQLISTETGAHVWADRFDGDRSNLGQLQSDIVSRLANSLGIELVKAEALRAARERPSNPDAVDLVMRGQAVLYSNPSVAAFGEAIALFERALALDPQNLPAMTGLANALAGHAIQTHDAGDAARAEKLTDAVLAVQPDNSTAHRTKGLILGSVKHEMRSAIAEAERAIALDSSDADAHAEAGWWKGPLGRSEEGIAGVQAALRLSPRDRDTPFWHFYLCALHNYLQHWEQAIEWCEKSRAGMPDNPFTYVHLAAAYAWAGHGKEAKEAADHVPTLLPGFTVQSYADLASRTSDDPTFKVQAQRIVEGLRKAGMTEGEKKTN